MTIGAFCRRYSGFSVLALTAALAIPPRALAQGDSGFLRGQGNLDFSVAYGVDTYDRFWIGSESVEDAPFGRVSRHTVNAYAAYGLRDDMDLAFNASYVYVETDEVFDSEKDLQDLFIQFKWRVYSKEFGSGAFNMLLAPALKAPMTSYEDNAVPALGDGQFDLRLRTVLQCHFHNGGFLALDTGYDVRDKEPANEWPFHLTGGFTFAGSFTLSGFYSYLDSLDGYDIGGGPFPGVEEDYDRLGAGAYYRLSDSLGLTANVWTTPSGKNTGDVDGASLGVVYRI